MKRTVAAILLIIVIACSRDLEKWEAHRAIADSLLTAAAAGDTTLARHFASGSDVLERLASIRRLEPTLLGSGNARLQTERGFAIADDSAYVHFVFPHNGRTERIDVGYVKDGQRWRVYYLGFPDRM